MEKKAYSKPKYVAEKYDFSQSIAVTCYTTRPSGSYANHWTPQTCAWVESDGEIVFLQSTEACQGGDNEYTDPSQYDHGCYHTSQGTNIFSS